MSEVAIIGIGIHPFGRTEGMTGLQQGVHAAREHLVVSLSYPPFFQRDEFQFQL
jgi:hypothetical protein